MAYQPQNPLPTQPIRPRHKRPNQIGAIKIVLIFAALLTAILLGLLVLIVIGLETGPIGFVAGLISATIPVPIYVVLVLWLDRYEAEPPWMLATAFFWGALVATFFAFLLNTTGHEIVNHLADAEAGEVFAAVISAPIVEECGKAFIVFVFFFAKKDEFDGVVDGIVYASMVALGFAMTENILYYGKSLEHGGGGLTGTIIIRGFFAPFSHPLFTSMTGVGLGLARQSSNLGIKVITPLVGLLMAIFMHAIWNGSAVVGGGGVFFLTYLVIMVPSFLIMLIVISMALRREGQVVREFLLPDLQRGVITKSEYDQLGTILGRMSSSFDALTTRGVGGWRNRMKFNQTASELAFHRSRVARGVHSAKYDPTEQETAYQDALQGLIHQIRPR